MCVCMCVIPLTTLTLKTSLHLHLHLYSLSGVPQVECRASVKLTAPLAHRDYTLGKGTIRTCVCNAGQGSGAMLLTPPALPCAKTAPQAASPAPWVSLATSSVMRAQLGKRTRKRELQTAVHVCRAAKGSIRKKRVNRCVIHAPTGPLALAPPIASYARQAKPST